MCTYDTHYPGRRSERRGCAVHTLQVFLGCLQFPCMRLSFRYVYPMTLADDRAIGIYEVRSYFHSAITTRVVRTNASLGHHICDHRLVLVFCRTTIPSSSYNHCASDAAGACRERPLAAGRGIQPPQMCRPCDGCNLNIRFRNDRLIQTARGVSWRSFDNTGKPTAPAFFFFSQTPGSRRGLY